MKITDNIKKILEAGKFEENIYLLPDVQLDRKDYQEVNKILMSLGGKWKTRVGHIFTGTQEELESALFEVLEAGETQTLDEIKKQFQYFPTPSKLAEKIVDLAEIKCSDRVLEPSAGQGAIAGKIISCLSLTMVELKEDNYDILAEKYSGEINCIVFKGDFLKQENIRKFDKIIANPPFSKNQDVKHILHMYDLLEEGGRLVSIASSIIQHKTTKLHDQLNALNPEFIEVEEGAFKESGTMVSTVVVVLNKN